MALRFFYIILYFFLAFGTACSLALADNYTVGPGDNLDITVYDHKDLSVKSRVAGDGTIRFPLIGEFNVLGKTPSEISVMIERKLGDGYILNPQVAVSMSEYRSRKATILGEVDKPGLYDLVGRVFLLELISKAGGLGKDAGREIIITRNFMEEESPGQEVIRIDLRRLVEEGDLSQNILIMNGDNVFIPQVDKIYVTGEVRRPASYQYDKDLTLIQVITNAGGLTDKASARNIRIIREKNGEKKVIRRVPMDARVLPNDVVVVPESFF
ncbi:polysaccharide export outer membrane protein [Desulfobotulus alkaliphilus]|uniref:Polysaccharide export outer membrane protein n=1 Tax=Desulfobotulus alkaliphilus TaxID=622671 RepID=A0A562RGP8_9BACT|nr:polysaccharide biosynthesis/export family protein [Desulfobotulus alkaliphilus]TWI68198.1 polysaccharide export outer membrane protein [Desulfobotulus alkaliphilus]